MNLASVRAALAAQDWELALMRVEDLVSDLPTGAPELASAFHLGAVALLNLEDPASALTYAERAVLARPENAAAWCQLGVVHAALADAGPTHYIEAHMAFERAYNMAPDMPTTAIGLASSAYTLGQHDLALTLLRQAQSAAPNPKARLAEAGILLRQGHYAEGWEKFEARLELVEGAKNKPYRGTLDDLHDKTVIVRIEQGNGDHIQFLRYVPQLRPFCRELILEAFTGLEALSAAMTDVRTVTAPLLSRPTATSVSLLSLPLLLAPAIGWDLLPPLTVPGQFRGPRSGIGLCPASIIDGPNRVRRKNPPIELFGQLATNFGPFRSLTHADLGTADWLETAMVVGGLDLVITVDTGVAHLAASLGIETWILQRFDACWRWNDGWYSSARIFQQPAPGDWASVFHQIHQAFIEKEVSRARSC